MSRDTVLHRVRTALGRSVGDAPPPEPPPLPAPPVIEDKLAAFTACAEKLGLTVTVVDSPEEARPAVRALLAGRTAVCADDEFLTTCGIGGIDGVVKGINDAAQWREACARHPVGITSAEYALAYTGTLVMTAGPGNPRLVSLLPEEHIAVLPLERLISGLPELLAREPQVFERSSSLVLITGSSSTGDIEQLLIKGVHGPRMVRIVFVRHTAR